MPHLVSQLDELARLGNHKPLPDFRSAGIYCFRSGVGYAYNHDTQTMALMAVLKKDASVQGNQRVKLGSRQLKQFAILRALFAYQFDMGGLETLKVLPKVEGHVLVE